MLIQKNWTHLKFGGNEAENIQTCYIESEQVIEQTFPIFFVICTIAIQLTDIEGQFMLH